MASVAVAIGFSPATRQLIAEWRTAPARIVEALDRGMAQFIVEVEASVQLNQLSGRAGSGGGGKTPVGLRGGELRQAVQGVKDRPLGGFVGTTAGTTNAYARAILGPDNTTIKPSRAKHLWVPVADNLGGSMRAKYTPQALFSAFDRKRIKIFRSKAGNTVVFVEDPRNEDGSRARYKRNTKGKSGFAGRTKGDLKGKLMFVLMDEVIVYGTDALAIGVRAMGPRGAELLTARLRAALPGAGGVA